MCGARMTQEEAIQEKLRRVWQAYKRSKGVPPEGYSRSVTDDLELVEEVGNRAWNRKTGSTTWVETESFRGAR
jgi:hypothetical protein